MEKSVREGQAGRQASKQQGQAAHALTPQSSQARPHDLRVQGFLIRRSKVPAAALTSVFPPLGASAMTLSPERIFQPPNCSGLNITLNKARASSRHLEPDSCQLQSQLTTGDLHK